MKTYRGMTRNQMIEKIATAKVEECKTRNEKKFGDGLPRMNENFSYWVKFLETYPMESKKYPAFSLIGEYKALEA